MRETEPIALRPRHAGRLDGGAATSTSGRETSSVTVFNRRELNAILTVYGRRVATGDWRDYALDLLPEKAVFSIFRRSSECPLYRIEKCPRLAKKQGAFSVVAPAGLILKRGHELERVLAVLDRGLRLID